MGGPFRAIVGGTARYRWTFAPAAWIRVDNNSTQYFKLDELDDYVVPGQVNKFINVDGIVSVTGIFAAPPGASQGAPIAGQIAQVWTYDVGAAGSPLGPSPGLLLPIGLDSPEHFHTHSALHSHASATHLHAISGTHAHTHSTTHRHALNIQAGVIATNVGLDANGQLVAAAGPQPEGTVTDVQAPGPTDADAPGPTDDTTPGNTASQSPGSSDLENVQHTHP